MRNTSVARKKQMDKEGLFFGGVESRILGNTYHGKESI